MRSYICLLFLLIWNPICSFLEFLGSLVVLYWIFTGASLGLCGVGGYWMSIKSSINFFLTSAWISNVTLSHGYWIATGLLLDIYWSSTGLDIHRISMGFLIGYLRDIISHRSVEPIGG